MPLIYTVQETDHQIGRTTYQSYDGFCKAMVHGCVEHEFRLPPAEANFLGLVMWEDSISPWWLENSYLAVDELKRLYRGMPGIEAKICLVPISAIERSI